MIDVMNEELINFREAAALPPFRREGRPAHISTIFRFAQRGARSSTGEFVRLEVLKLPTGNRTSREAVERFIAALNPGQTGTQATPRQRTKAIAKAEAELNAAGIA